MPRKLTKVVINSVTVKDDSASEKKIFNWKYKRNAEDSVGEMELEAPKSINDLVTITNGLTIEVWEGFTTSTDRKIFKGNIREFQAEGGKLTLTCKDKLDTLIRKNVNKIYDETIDASAGQISEIAKDLIETQGGLTAQVVATGTAEGETISQFKCINTDIFERLKKLAESVDYQIWYDPEIDKVRFEPRGNNDPGITLTVGTEIIKLPEWEYSTDGLINDLRIDGATVQTQITESGQIGTDAGFETTGITLTKTPDIVELFIDASNPPTTQREGGSEDGSTGNFYFVDKENKKIKPVNGSTFTSGHYAKINYVWSSPAPIRMVNEDSIDQNEPAEKQMSFSDIKSIADAEARATQILGRRSVEFVRASDILVKYHATTNAKVGDIITVVDTKSTPNVNRALVVTEQTISYPSATQEITVGDKEWRIVDWNEAVEARLKRLEEQFVRNQDIILELRTITNDEKVAENARKMKPRYRKVFVRNIGGDTLIWGNAVFGKWGSFNWGGAANQSFILGNSLAGILGSSKLGSQSSTERDYFVQQYQNLYTEEFTDTDFEDTTNTTATWSGGSVNFTSGQVAQSESIDFFNGQITAAVLAPTEVSGTLLYEMTADGTNWETATPNTIHTFANPGTDLRFRITENAAATAEVSNVVISGYH